MKKLLTASIVVLAVGLVMVIVGGALRGIDWQLGFDGQYIANALNNIGYIVTLLSGIVLTATAISCAIKGEKEECKPAKKNKKDKE